MSESTAPLNPRPEVSAASPWTFPDSHHEQLDSGLRVVRVPIPGQQVVTVELGIDVPLSAEDPAHLGVANLVLTTSDEGTRHHPGAELAEAIESIGASYDGACGLTSSSVSIDVPRGHLDPALDLLAEIVTSSALADEDVLRQMAQARSQLAQAAQNGPSLAGLAVSREVWPLGHRASRPTAGTASTLDAITTADVRDFRDATWLPAGGVLVLAGADVDGVDLGAFSQWTGAREDAAEEVRSDPIRADGPTRVLLVDRPDAVQADVRIQTRVPGRQDSRWAALRVACGVLGGTFGSRLNTVLREEKGWSYGVSAAARAMRDGGLVTVGGAFRAEVAAQAVRAALDLVDPGSPSLEDAEVRDARNHAVGVAPLQYDTAGAVASQVTTLEMAGLTGAWVDHLMADTAAVTTDLANQAWRELLPASTWRVGIAGPAGTLGPALEEAGFMVEVISPSELLD
ncbi:insulinase family protein [Acidipropionibacterium jensenii]|uniref:Insulinase family protein n=1 Tax=Acidipropionibacterium jensenii TaxID=1749 RepID=A0A3Q9ULU1_9ACTN|nr:insulinase family protein [Acidipropionibacterium jensenii]